MNINKAWIMVFIVMGVGLELGACSFLRRYGANSYITNIPLFFKKQDPEAPQRKSADLHGVNHEEYMQENNTIEKGEVIQKDAVLQSKKEIASEQKLAVASK